MLGYDLLNEPIPNFPNCRNTTQVGAALSSHRGRIREVDKNHIVILGGAQWDTDFTVFGPPFDSNAMYTFHKYWMKPEQKEIQQYVDFRDKYHVPIWMSESGENTDGWITQFRELLDKNQIGGRSGRTRKWTAQGRWCHFHGRFIGMRSSPTRSCRAEWETPRNGSRNVLRRSTSTLLSQKCWTTFSSASAELSGYLKALGLASTNY